MNNAVAEAVLRSVTTMAQTVVDYAEMCGVVLTIEQKPKTPLAMGHYDTVISVRIARNAKPLNWE